MVYSEFIIFRSFPQPATGVLIALRRNVCGAVVKRKREFHPSIFYNRRVHPGQGPH